MSTSTNLKRSYWFLLITLALSFYNLGVIWLIEIYTHPLFYIINAETWPTFFGHHWQTVQLLVLPAAGLTFLSAALLVRFPPNGVPEWATWFGLALQVVVFGLTGVIWAPLQAQLSHGNAPELVQRLIQTHWIRVGVTTAFAILLFWMTVRSFAYESS